MSQKNEKQANIDSSWLHVLIGSIPIIALSSLCFYLLYMDCKANGYSFLSKNKFYSNTNPNDFFENVTQPSHAHSKSNFVCSRYFTDYVISEAESSVLLKFSKLSFEKTSANVVFLDEKDSYDGDFLNVYG